MLLKIDQEMPMNKNSKDSVISREFSIFSSHSGTETWRRYPAGTQRQLDVVFWLYFRHHVA